MWESTTKLVAQSVFLLFGLAGNMFILVMSFTDWRKTHSWNPYAVITISIGISNILLQTTTFLNEFFVLLLTNVSVQETMIKYFIATQISLFINSLLFSLCLCFYYCVKILQMNQPFFRKVKQEIARITPWFLSVSMLVSLGIGIPSYWDLHWTLTGATNSSASWIQVNVKLSRRYQWVFILQMLISSGALIVFFCLAVTIIFSLCRHMRRMKLNSTGFNKSSLDVHVSAAKTLTLILLLHIYFFAAVCILFNSPLTWGTWFFNLSYIMVGSFPSLDSFILITGNSQLWNSLKNICLLCRICHKIPQDRHTVLHLCSGIHPPLERVTEEPV
ncbi:bitter taste receptor 41 [Xenopus tropicalis]|uniref:Taste receptor type 2 n=1 Tax=Xenopus tropicalis TaxID=8364 RepID=Q2AB46_XENTR|nr:bitter taste receptor 41 [Xenopus tropicalis]BAE80421.1 bitter taste receptor [Xenopus tropicalis]|eukprot:NP_001165496.1 bitter taste receptor 41 [Xenopus tropicalis]